MGICKRHLNWTWILALVLGFLIMDVLGSIPYVEYIQVPFILAWYIYISIWNLTQKGLSRKLTLILFVMPLCPPVGIFYFLRLPNLNKLENKVEGGGKG